MTASQTILQEIEGSRKAWRNLWWRMAGEVKSEYEKIKGTDVFEFFPLFDLWFASIQKRTKDLNTATKQISNNGK